MEIGSSEGGRIVFCLGLMNPDNVFSNIQKNVCCFGKSCSLSGREIFLFVWFPSSINKKIREKNQGKKIQGKKNKKSKLKMYRATLLFGGALCEDVWLQLVQFWRTFWDFS